ncbi:unnamed protein product [Rotaria sp. Silwood2]|nr:unnamed protein product [Rotaria sp. Silwood2]CAF4711497.1 unnamed protein product [Rotaria sp. Silwood2]
MSENPRYRPYITNTKYSPIGSSNKLNLLLQRSLRYSYRQRCCECCPTILCELLFPLIIIGLLALIRYGTNALIREMNENPGSIPINFDHRLCSQDKNTTTTLSKDLFKRCFKLRFLSSSSTILKCDHSSVTIGINLSTRNSFSEYNCMIPIQLVAAFCSQNA